MLTKSVSIKNSLFPNVREVKSNTSSFKSGDMLVKQTEDSGDVLLNTFCKKKDEKIDLKGIMIISDWAFDGCMSVNVLNEEEIRVCERYAFNNSALLMQPFTDGLRFAGRILIDAEEGADARLAFCTHAENRIWTRSYILHRKWTSFCMERHKNGRHHTI